MKTHISMKALVHLRFFFVVFCRNYYTAGGGDRYCHDHLKRRRSVNSTRLIFWETPKHNNNSSSNSIIVLVRTQRWYLFTKIRATSFGAVLPSLYRP